ncbi:MAG: carboxylating nicotinate-nucleotide diphosphorylase [Ahrensia sp.]|nr:carboxylating nicotinate-nucleotide diphosphorylase [Ahrensia sp.]
MSTFPAELPDTMIKDAVRAALQEDLGRAGDLTSQATISPEAKATAVLDCREEGVVCGVELARAAFQALDPGLKFKALHHDGDAVTPGTDIARISGNARSLLGAERVALNFICHLSGIATRTARFVERVAHTKAAICCTRKTTPGLRSFEKYAVRCGGGSNHRYGLDDAILIKDNHIAVAGGVAQAIRSARAFAGHLVKIEVEVDTLEQLRTALDAGPDVVMLDNMSLDDLREGVALVAGRIPVEASGNVSLGTVKDIAETGVDMISTSKITMSAGTLDLGLDMVIE